VSAGMCEAIMRRGRVIEVVFRCRERGGRGGLYRRGWLGRGARVVGWRVDQTSAVQGRVRGGLLREVADDIWARPVGVCGDGGRTDSGAAALAGWASFSAWTK
jgi:hypothetical protein